MAAAQQGVLRADDPVEVAARAAAAAEAASTAEAAAAAARAKRMPNSKLAIPSWLSEELDDTAAQEGLLIPVPNEGAPAPRGPKAAKALVVRPPAPPAAAVRVAAADPEAPGVESEAAGTRHAAVVAALAIDVKRSQIAGGRIPRDAEFDESATGRRVGVPYCLQLCFLIGQGSGQRCAFFV